MSWICLIKKREAAYDVSLIRKKSEATCEFSTFRIDRAEPKSKRNLKPTKAFVRFYENTIVCWPTKLALTPKLGDDVLSNIFTKPASLPEFFSAERPKIGKIPWSQP